MPIPETMRNQNKTIGGLANLAKKLIIAGAATRPMPAGPSSHLGVQHD